MSILSLQGSGIPARQPTRLPNNRAWLFSCIEILIITTPNWVHPSKFHKTMKTRPGPSLHLFHQSMFDRIEVSVCCMPVEILPIPNNMFSKPPLPNRRFAFLSPGDIANSTGTDMLVISTGE